jgi:hypothetical protein
VLPDWTPTRLTGRLGPSIRRVPNRRVKDAHRTTELPLDHGGAEPAFGARKDVQAERKASEVR